MNNRYEREHWHRDDDTRQGQGRRGNDDRRQAWQRDERDRWPSRVEGRDRNRWDERDDRYAHAERTFDQGRQYYGSERQYGEGQDYRSRQEYRPDQEHRYGPQDYRYGQGSPQDYRHGQSSQDDYRYGQGSGQDRWSSENRWSPENRWASENRWGSENRWDDSRPTYERVPYAGSGEPRWGESARGTYQGSGEFGAYDANRFGRGNTRTYGTYGTYGSSTGMGADFNRNREGGGFFGRGPKGYTRSDDRIREDVCDRLSYDDEVDASDITVTVEAGEVTLEGTVPDRYSKHRAEDIADNVNGVRDVHNKLKARRGFIQEVGDRLLGREEEHEQGHAGSGTRNAPAGTRTTTGTTTPASVAQSTSMNMPNGRS